MRKRLATYKIVWRDVLIVIRLLRLLSRSIS